jgi:hypoxanthine-DNA glycosylase
MAKVKGFDPIARKDARVVILGTLPGRLALEKREYYAQPRNAFWPIMGELFGAWPHLPYKDRQSQLIKKGIAVWDVCAAGDRADSLDSKIDLSTVEVNDFETFLTAYPRVGLVCFNGGTARRIHRRRVLPNLSANIQARIRWEVLPSTAPTNTKMTFDQKLSTWHDVLCKETD